MEDFSSGHEPRAEAESRGGGSNPLRIRYGVSGSAVSSPSRVRGGAQTARRSSTIFSTQGGLSWHYNIVNCGQSCSHWGWGSKIPVPPPLAYASGGVYVYNFTLVIFISSTGQRRWVLAYLMYVQRPIVHDWSGSASCILRSCDVWYFQCEGWINEASQFLLTIGRKATDCKRSPDAVGLINQLNQFKEDGATKQNDRLNSMERIATNLYGETLDRSIFIPIVQPPGRVCFYI